MALCVVSCLVVVVFCCCSFLLLRVVVWSLVCFFGILGLFVLLFLAACAFFCRFCVGSVGFGGLLYLFVGLSGVLFLVSLLFNCIAPFSVWLC